MTLVYNEDSHRIKLYDIDHHLLFEAPCKNDSVASNAWRPDAGCPPGTYTVGMPEVNLPNADGTMSADERSMGPFFIPVFGIEGHSGIGIHGGGSCVAPNSMAPRQGWCPTENCFRMQNEDLGALCKLIPHGGSAFQVHQTP